MKKELTLKEIRLEKQKFSVKLMKDIKEFIDITDVRIKNISVDYCTLSDSCGSTKSIINRLDINLIYE